MRTAGQAAQKAGWPGTFDFDQVTGTLEGIAQAIRSGLEKAAPTKTTVELGIELAVKNGQSPYPNPLITLFRQCVARISDERGRFPGTGFAAGRGRPRVFKLKRGLVLPGFSGSPLLDCKAEAVAGIVESTRSARGQAPRATLRISPVMKAARSETRKATASTISAGPGRSSSGPVVPGHAAVIG